MLIQKKIKERHTCASAFNLLDHTKSGFLVIKDFSVALPRHFDIPIEHKNVILLFKQIDTDKDGIVRFAEFETFYSTDFDELIK